MSEKLYLEKLAWFKQNEKPEVVLIIADHPELIKIVIAWNNLNIGRIGKLTELNSESHNEGWEWLWENTTYSRAELKERSGVASEVSLEGKMKPLIGNRILYPDGTVNSFVQRYLREQVVKLFEIKARKSARTS